MEAASLLHESIFVNTMVALAPGYSLSEIISGIKFIVEALDALKKTGGASSDYQQIIQDVNDIQDILQDLQKTTPTETNARHFHLICNKAKQLETILKEFVDSTKKYNDALRRPSGWSHETTRKLQWHVIETPKVKVLQSKISSQLPIIEMLHLLLMS